MSRNPNRRSQPWVGPSVDILGKETSKHGGPQDTYERDTNEKPNAGHWHNENTVRKEGGKVGEAHRAIRERWELTLREWEPTGGLKPTFSLTV